VRCGDTCSHLLFFGDAGRTLRFKRLSDDCLFARGSAPSRVFSPLLFSYDSRPMSEGVSSRACPVAPLRTCRPSLIPPFSPFLNAGRFTFRRVCFPARKTRRFRARLFLSTPFRCLSLPAAVYQEASFFLSPPEDLA